MNLYVPTYIVSDNRDIIHFKINANDTLLTTQAKKDRQTTCALTDTASFVQEQLYDPFYGQIQERINEVRQILIKLSVGKLFPLVSRSNQIVLIAKFLRQRVVNKAHHTQEAGQSKEQEMVYYHHRHLYSPSMSVD